MGRHTSISARSNFPSAQPTFDTSARRHLGPSCQSHAHTIALTGGAHRSVACWMTICLHAGPIRQEHPLHSTATEPRCSSAWKLGRAPPDLNRAPRRKNSADLLRSSEEGAPDLPGPHVSELGRNARVSCSWHVGQRCSASRHAHTAV